MIITNMPVVLLVWAAEFYLFMVTMRLILPHFKAAEKSGYYTHLKKLVDPVHAKLRSLLMKKTDAPDWISWTVLIFALLIVRKILIVLL